jgi:hypothetical protein
LSKVTLNTIGSRYGSIDALNDNFDNIEDAFDNTLSLDGSTPNEMAAPLNMGGNRVINVSNAINNTDAPNLQQVNAIISNASSGLIAQQREKQTASAAQTVVTLTGLTYFPNSNNLSVYVNGVKYYVGDAYTETSPTQVTFVEPLTEGDRLEFVTNEAVANQVGDAANISYTPQGAGATSTSVASKLREFVSVKDFGAVGDGVTDDTAAIQAAIDYCVTNAKVLFLPKSTYLVTANLTHPDMTTGRFLHVEGEGKQTIINASNAVTKVFDFGRTAGNALYYATIRNLTIRSSSFRVVDYGIYAPYCSHSNFVDLWVSGFKEAGIYIGSTLEGYCNNFTNVLTTFSKIGFHGVGSFNQNAFTHCKFWLCDIGLAVKDGFANLASNCLFEGNAKVGAALLTSNFTFDTCYFEVNAKVNPDLFPAGTTPGISVTTPAVTVLADVFIAGSGTGFPFTTTFSPADASESVTLINCYTRPTGPEASGFCFVYAQASNGLQLQNCRCTVDAIPLIKTYGLAAYAAVRRVSAADSSGFSTNFLFESLPNGRRIPSIEVPTIRVKTENEVNYAQPEFSRWVALEAVTGTFDRAGIADRHGRLVPVWAINNAATSYTGGRGFTIAAADFPQNVGKVFAFSIDLKAEAATTSGYIFAAGFPDGSFSIANTNWSRNSCFFVWPASGNISFGVAKAGNAGALFVANPVLCELGANYSEMFGMFKQERQYYGTAAPTTGSWVRGDIVWNTAPAASGTPGWVCVTAGAPGTWKAMANLAA